MTKKIIRAILALAIVSTLAVGTMPASAEIRIGPAEGARFNIVIISTRDGEPHPKLLQAGSTFPITREIKPGGRVCFSYTIPGDLLGEGRNNGAKVKILGSQSQVYRRGGPQSKLKTSFARMRDGIAAKCAKVKRTIPAGSTIVPVFKFVGFKNLRFSKGGPPEVTFLEFWVEQKSPILSIDAVDPPCGSNFARTALRDSIYVLVTLDTGDYGSGVVSGTAQGDMPFNAGGKVLAPGATQLWVSVRPRGLGLFTDLGAKFDPDNGLPLVSELIPCEMRVVN